MHTNLVKIALFVVTLRPWWQAAVACNCRCDNDDGRAACMTLQATDDSTITVHSGHQTLDNVASDVFQLAVSSQPPENDSASMLWMSSTESDDVVAVSIQTTCHNCGPQCVEHLNCVGLSEVTFDARKSSAASREEESYQSFAESYTDGAAYLGNRQISTSAQTTPSVCCDNVVNEMIVDHEQNDTTNHARANHVNSPHDSIFIQESWHTLPKTTQADVSQKIVSTVEIEEDNLKERRQVPVQENSADNKTEIAAQNTDTFLLQVHCLFNIRCHKQGPHQSTLIEDDCRKRAEVDPSIPLVLQANRNATESEDLLHRQTDKTSVVTGNRTRSCAIGRRYLKHSTRMQNCPGSCAGMTQSEWNPPVTLRSKHADIADASAAPPMSLKQTRKRKASSRGAKWVMFSESRAKTKKHDRQLGVQVYTCPQCTFEDTDRTFVMHHARLAHAQRTFKF